MSSFFKKIGKAISSPFKKGGAISNVFKKGGAIAQGISGGLGGISKVLGKVGEVGGKVLNNPLTNLVVGAVAPELLPELQVGGRALVEGAKIGSKLAGTASRLTDVKSYKKAKDAGDHLENLGDAFRRAKEVQGAGEEAKLQFA
jgi:hypothetical protein